ncbi:MAG: glycosyltransferase family 2 protein [Clostridia bacterium]|nr:glycosyltransferase family 2 protein [Clostridia bacterium]
MDVRDPAGGLAGDLRASAALRRGDGGGLLPEHPAHRHAEAGLHPRRIPDRPRRPSRRDGGDDYRAGHSRGRAGLRRHHGIITDFRSSGSGHPGLEERGKGRVRILAIIPAYNEQDNLTKTLADLREHCPEIDPLVVNDCSTDGTPELLRQWHIPHLDLAANLGIGGAVQAGYLYAQQEDYDIAVQFDGDGQHDASFLAALIRPVAEGHADIAIGSRFIEKEGFQSSGARRAGIGFLSRLIRMLSGVRVLDVTSGMRAVNRRFIAEYAQRYPQDYPEPEALLDAGLRGARIIEVPVRMREREGGRSSISPLGSVYYMIKVSLALILGRISTRRAERRRA